MESARARSPSLPPLGGGLEQLQPRVAAMHVTCVATLVKNVRGQGPGEGEGGSYIYIYIYIYIERIRTPYLPLGRGLAR